MSTLVATRSGLANSLADLFAPVDEGPIAALLAEHDERRATLERVASVFADAGTREVLCYFTAGAEVRSESYAVERMFGGKRLAKARKALGAEYWQRALASTDVLACMPTARRTEWCKQLQSLDVPDFTADALRSTLAEHLAARASYFAERIDGLFSALSPEHVTNSSAGFGGKLIIGHMVDDDGDPVWTRIPLIVDLRVIVARFMGRTDIGEGSSIVDGLTRQLIRYARRECCGEWVVVDGGAIEIKLHKSGTCHVRLHAELVWRLNAVLASVHPGAIPESARTRPKRGSVKKMRVIDLVLRPLPFAVVQLLSAHDQDSDDLGPNEWQGSYGFDRLDKHIRTEVLRTLASIGGVEVTNNPLARACGRVRFDYDPTDVLRELVASGCVPDTKAHQYYPTPPDLAARAVELADIGPADVVLEPSAGQGHLAEILPGNLRTTCVEASALHCAILRAKGLDVLEGDFLKVSPFDIGPVDRVVMNPPFDRGQWRAHVEHAATFLADGGRLVAILPASAVTSDVLPGWSLVWSEPIEFVGVSIKVVLLKAERAG